MIAPGIVVERVPVRTVYIVPYIDIINDKAGGQLPTVFIVDQDHQIKIGSFIRIARGCGARGSNGDLTGVPFDTLFNEVVWKIKFGLNK